MLNSRPSIFLKPWILQLLNEIYYFTLQNKECNQIYYKKVKCKINVIYTTTTFAGTGYLLYIYNFVKQSENGWEMWQPDERDNTKAVWDAE